MISGVAEIIPHLKAKCDVVTESMHFLLITIHTIMYAIYNGVIIPASAIKELDRD